MEFNIYSVILAISIIMLMLLVLVGRRQNITYYLLIFMSITISSFGYYTISTATGIEAAIIGQKVVYLGAVFTPVFLLFGVMKMCKIQIMRIPGILVAVFSLFVLYFTFTIGVTEQYYANISLGEEFGMTYLVKDYGPMHILYPMLLVGNTVAMFIVLLYGIIKKKNISYRVTTVLFIMEFVTIGLYFIARVVDTSIELFMIAYMVDEVLLLLLIRRIGMYEISDSIANSLNENSKYGYIIIDKNMRYVSSNVTAELYLPELKSQKVDAEFSQEKTPVIYEKFGAWIQNPVEGNFECLIEDKDRCLKCSAKELHHGKWRQKIGYLIELIDDTQQQKYLQLLNNYSTNLEQEVINQTEHINMMQDKIVLSMADMVENRDSNTGGHIKRTSQVIRIFTTELKQYGKIYGFTNEFLEYVAKAAPMHDLGKIAVDDSVLRKPGKYTPEEFEEMKKHSEKGAEIVGQILDGINDDKFVSIAKNMAHYHHEKWNGQGYPTHLVGEDIPLEARIMALADVFDALVSKRCYKEKMNYDEAFKIIEDSLGSHFDPELGRLFIKCRARLEVYYDGMEKQETV